MLRLGQTGVHHDRLAGLLPGPFQQIRILRQTGVTQEESS